MEKYYRVESAIGSVWEKNRKGNENDKNCDWFLLSLERKKMEKIIKRNYLHIVIPLGS